MAETKSAFYYDRCLLTGDTLDRLQSALHAAAPEWERLTDRYLPDVRLADPGSLRRTAEEEIPKQKARVDKIAGSLGGPTRSAPLRAVSVQYQAPRKRAQLFIVADEKLFGKRPDGFTYWHNRISLWVKEQTINGLRFTRWADAFFSSVCQSTAPAYARACRPEEFEAKNILNTAQSQEAIGVDLTKSLPGLYWINFFGPPWVELIGRQKLLSAPAHEVAEVGEGVALLLAGSPAEWDSESYRETERRVLAHLGEAYFFDRRHPDRPTVAPPFWKESIQ